MLIGCAEESNTETNTTTETTTTNNGLQEIRDGIKEVKDGVNSIKEEVKKEFDESPLGQVKEGIDNVKEIVSDVKEIKDTIKGNVRTPLKSKKCKGENYQNIEDKFEEAGFTNIKLKKDADLKVGILNKDGEVESVTINGDKKFDEGDAYPSNAEVIITYHTYKDK